MSEYLFHDELEKTDPRVHEIIERETERQFRKLIMIPSESEAPLAVRKCLGSVFQNLYAEGYPDEESRYFNEDEILDFTARINNFRRYSDPRYYKGVEFADIIEALARRRCAELFATDQIRADDLFVNVQPLSGAPANNAAYHALIQPGDTIMGMNLLHGGHLTHGSSVNRSGKLYKVIHYNINPQNEQIDYDAVAQLAQEHRPKVIIAGYSSYPWVPDWKKFREIADSIDAFVLADVSHIAGLIAARVVPSPVGYADIITFTTHKTLCGPRGACIVTTSESLSKKIDKAVFPGEQGGPHVNVFAAMAVAFKLATTEKFKSLQQNIVENCNFLVQRLQQRGLRIAYGGSNTHLANIDCKSIKSRAEIPLSGDMAARILDLVGIVTNANTIPGDKNTARASGIRLGTPWVTQRGLDKVGVETIADIIADTLFACEPYLIEGKSGILPRVKVDFKVLEKSKIRVREIVGKIQQSSPNKITKTGYPSFFFLDDKSSFPVFYYGYDESHEKEELVTIEMSGENIRQFINFAFSANLDEMNPGESCNTRLKTLDEAIEGKLIEISPYVFHFICKTNLFGLAITWLRDLSDGYISFDDDLYRRMPGPMTIIEKPMKSIDAVFLETSVNEKPYFIGNENKPEPALSKFQWEINEQTSTRKTPLFETHQKLSAKIIPFAGWEMPVWYSTVMEEHLAVRQAAGIFDVAHMGVYQAEGPDACVFLDCVCANDIGSLKVGESCYTHFLDPAANVIDDLLVYRHHTEKYLVVVNASNDDKDWAWLNSVKAGNVMVDSQNPWVQSFGKKVNLRNLRDPKEGKDMRVDLALQGPKSRDILLALPWDDETRRKITKLNRTQLCSATLNGVDLIISRTGYTGEKIAFELFIHPDHLVSFWNLLMEKGQPFGLKPCGLGARDSLRTEAGLPLYGHEMGGELNLGVAEAGFAPYVKIYKPWFIGRESYLEREKERKGMVVRFRFANQHVRMAHLGDEVLDENGQNIGIVTSCAIDSQGFLTGQAFLPYEYNKENQKILIYQQSKKQADLRRNTNQKELRSSSPDEALVVSRFMK